MYYIYILAKKLYGLILQLAFQKTYNIAVIGGYHGGNLGDMALGIATQKVIKRLGYKSCLKTIYSIGKLPYPKISHAILGGGAIGYEDSLSKVQKLYFNDLSKVALLGVDFKIIPNNTIQYNTIQYNTILLAAYLYIGKC
jgi:hypothetical protein